MVFLVKQLQKEKRYFNKLDFWARKLIYSIALTNLVSPLLSIFISAFIFRQTNDIKSVALYNLGMFIGLPLAFFINGFLIKKIRVATVYIFSITAQGLVLIPLIFFSWISFYAIFTLGLLFGISAGFYWANRNFLTLDLTKSEERSYFSGLEVALGKFSGIIVPFVVGWFIILGEKLSLYSTERAYQLLLVFAIAVLIRAGYLIKNIKHKKLVMDKFPVLIFGSLWNKVRIFTFLRGIGEGGYLFIPTLMVLLLVGEEGVLGTLKSISAILSAFVIYFVAKKMKEKNRPFVLTISLLFQLVASLLFGISYSALTVIIYFILVALAGPFSWISLGPITLDVIDKDSEHKKIGRYNYVFDSEIYLNFGRILGASIFLFFAITMTTAAALRITPILLAGIQTLILPVIISMSKQTHKL